MHHIIIDKVLGTIYIKTVPPEPIEVEFKEIPLGETEINPLIEQQLPLIVQRTIKRKEYPAPDLKIIAQGGYLTSKQAALLMGISISALDHLASSGRIPVYRKSDSARLWFLLDDIAAYIKNIK